MRTVFVGTVAGSAVGLRALVEARLAPALVVTLPSDARARHSDWVDLAPLAAEGGSALLQTTNINGPETLAAISLAAPDLLLVVGWSQICRREFLDLAPLGAVGFHPAPLPRLRGRAVIPWTILTGMTETAATLFWLDEGTDSGPILLQTPVPVAPDETAASLYAKHTAALAAMLPDAVRLVAAGSPPRLAQDERLATWCARRVTEDGRIDWRAPSADVLRLIRAVGGPYPAAFTAWRGGVLYVDAARSVPDGWRYIGLPGQVQRLGPEGLVVRCGDGNAIEITAWRLGPDAPAARPRLHDRLGE